METVILFGVFEAIAVAGLLVLKRKKTVSDYILMGFFLLNGLNIFLSFLEIYNRNNGFPYPAFILVSSPFLLLHGPALWLYVKSLTSQFFSFKTKYLIHLLPFLIMVANLAITFYPLPTNERIEIFMSESFKNKIDYPIFIVMMTLSVFGYFTWSVRLIQKYNRRIRNYFSHTENYDLQWLKIVMILSAITYTTIYGAFFVDLFRPLASFAIMHKISFMLGAVYIIVLGFFGHRQGNVFSDKHIAVNLKQNKPINNEMPTLDNKDNEFIQKLLKFMDEMKPHLYQDINLATLAKQLDVPPEYLSRILNTQLKKTFFDFINHYRIEEFKKRCRQPENKNFTLLAIATDCGFNSKATFNRVFKNITGSTPGEYMHKSQ
ncbi:MAG: AraC family transcriptional regulator [Prolixibacteraceae bacterium]|nr:AraC family transcriptional regulator [Prolixibacteraceae bacterium]